MNQYVILRKKWRRDRIYIITSRGLNLLSEIRHGWSIAWLGRATDLDTALQASKETY